MSTLDELKDKLKTELEEIFNEMQTARDEIKLKSKLAQLELKDELNRIEHKFDHYKNKLEQIRREAEFNNQEVFTELQKLGDEIVQGYRRIRDSLKR